MGSKRCPKCGTRVYFKPEEAFVGISYQTFFCKKLQKKIGLCPISDEEHCSHLCDGKALPFTNNMLENDKIYINFLQEYGRKGLLENEA